VRSLTYEEVQRFDVGRVDPTTRYGAQWAGQTAVEGARMPTLDALIARATMQRPTIRFNVETKLSPLKPEETADPETFVRATLEVIARHGASTRVTIQSFDWRSLLVTRRLAPEIATACLTIETANTSNVRAVDGRPSPWLAGLDPEQFGGSIPRTVQAAGCATWSPFWRNVTPALVEEAHGLGLKVVPWTVNEPAEMARLVAMKVDGLITDYPDRAGPVLTAAGLAPR
jgi:glycerophosphoryl diester phosphodiesterase